LRNLDKLDISYNRLTSVKGINLHQIRALRQLNLSHNRLKKINFAQIGSEWSSLQVLNLSYNRLGHMTFAPLPRLNKLYLEKNSEVSFDPEFSDPFKLKELYFISIDQGTNIPDGLKRKLESLKP